MKATAKRYFRGAMNRVPYVRGLVERLRFFERFCPLDHYYSPIPKLADLQFREGDLFGPPPEQLPGINLNREAQLVLLRELSQYHADLPFTDEPNDTLRYHYNNHFFGHSDAAYLYAMIRHLQPRRIIEVGSGFSSRVMLDTLERFASPGQTHCTFIEPDPHRLVERMRDSDKKHSEIIATLVQNVDRTVFDSLSANDILFIDSSHVSKTGSDVQVLYFDILPRLASGVFVHIHDIFYPFEYPKQWIYDGRSWNEAYILRAFLQHNSAFQICLFPSYLEQFARDKVEELMPMALKSPGQSIWIRKN